MTIDFAQFTPDKLAKDTLYGGSVDMDWQPNANEPDAFDRIQVHLPAVTKTVLHEYHAGWEIEFPIQEYEGDEQAQLEAAIEDFENSDNYYGWSDTFFPVMNYAYPIDLRHEPDYQELASRIDQIAGCLSLVTVNDQDYLALSGGGMDLSWNICAAFIACECIPPLKYLAGLPHMASCGKYASNIPDDIAALVVACIPVAAECMNKQAENLTRSMERLINE